ncbi:MAG: sulfatase-like hydrolase/transferase [Inquilinaceae bacterium]
MTDQPNLLFLMSDQHSQRLAGCYGDPLVRTPNLDRLAARGVTFDNAYTPSPLCVPARMSLLTGNHPSSQDCWTNSDPLASTIPTTAHAAGAAGYRPVLIGRMHAIGPDQMHGYAEREVGDHSTNWVGGTAHSLGILDRTNDPFRVSIERSGPGQSSYELHDDDVAAATVARIGAIAEGRRNGDDRPFFLVSSYLLPHQPYVAKTDDYALYDGKVGGPEQPPAPPDREHPYLAAWRRHTGIETLDYADIVRSRTAYYALVTAFDRMVGRVLDALQESGLTDNTLIVYVSDHGDQIGERGLWWKQTFYEESVKVPMILSWPGHLPAGERRSQIVNLIDLAPTLCEALSAPALPGIDGRSFLGIARDRALPWLDQTFSEYCTDGMSPWTLPEPVQQRMIRSGPWKLVYYHGYRPQLFNLDDDPGEIRDLAEDPAHAAIRDALVDRVLAGWDPEAIASRIARTRPRKELLRTWSRQVQPPDQHRWTVRMEDNWLDDRARQDADT